MRQIVISDDGSSTIYQASIDEHYHSVNGATNESNHVFIHSALDHYLENMNDKQNINILEIGFGTGLNVWLTLLASKAKNISINFYTLEAYPLEDSLIESLNFAEMSPDQDLFRSIHQAPWNSLSKITDNFSLFKWKGDFTALDTNPFDCVFDVVYFDAFSPDKQPEMWETKNFQNLFYWMSDNAVLSTYCAKGAVRRSMKEVGFTVERLAGPPGKREMLRATKK